MRMGEAKEQWQRPVSRSVKREARVDLPQPFGPFKKV
jgi:hypothetical protein